MAYPVGIPVKTLTGTSTNEIEVTLPEYLPGDMIIIQLAQDGSSSSTFTIPSPWITLYTAGVGARQWIIYTIAGEDELEAPIITSTLTDGFTAIATTIRDFDPVTPFDSSAYLTATSAGGWLSPDFATTTDNCLIMYFMVEDVGPVHRYEAGQLNYLSFTNDGSVGNHVGYKVQYQAGSVQRFNIPSRTSNQSVMCRGVAIRNKLGGSLAPDLIGGPVRLANYGHGYTYALTGLITELGGAPISIDGIPVLNFESGPSTLNFSSDLESFVGIGGGGTTTSTSAWYAGVQSFPEIDLTQGLISFKSNFNGTGSDYNSYRGYLFFVIDVSGNWAAYRTAKKAQFNRTETTLFVFDVPSLTPLAASATQPDLSRINRFGFGYARVATTFTSGTVRAVIGQLFYWPRTGGFRIVGGGKDSAASAYSAGVIAQAGIYTDYFSTQGGGQVMSRAPLNLGGELGSPSYIKPGVGSSFEFKRVDFYQRTNEYYGDLQIKPTNSADIVDFSYSSTASVPSNKLVFSEDSSPSAQYNFASAIFSGLDVTWSSGVPCNSASFSGCFTIKTHGALFDGCEIKSSASLVALETSNPGNVIGCSFTQGDHGGHAIEITQPGTFAFVGNTFEGYGLDGTTDAAIYNNSGGHVALNVSGGGDTPTVRNGAGATTDVVSGAQVTVVGLATGSQVKVTKVSNGDVLFNGAESGGQISFSTTYIGAVRVDARKASASPFYKPWATQATTISGQTVEVTALQELDE